MNNKILTFFILFCLLTIPYQVVHASTKEFVFNEGHIALVGPPVINKDFYLIEFGFLTVKKIKSWDYNYNAFVTASIFEDWLDQPGKIRAGALGFKAGVITPTQPWIPVLFTLSGGFAKTVLHKQPLFGRVDDAEGKKSMLLVEASLLYRYDKYFARFAYQLGTVKYFKRHTFITLGVVY